MKRWIAWTAAAGLVITASLAGAADSSDKPPAKPAAAGASSGGPTTRPSVEDVMKEMKDSVEANPAIEPTQRPINRNAPGSPGTPGAPGGDQPSFKMEIDPAVLGVAPGMKPPPQRREGEMIVNRRGRLTRSPNGSQMIFVFEADAKDSPEAPVILLPCRILENMEDMVLERGDRITFVISGQVMVYRNNSYLLPTMMKLAIDKGNVQR